MKAWLKRFLIGISLLLLLAIGTGYWQITGMLREWGISQVQYHVEQLDLSHVRLSEVSFLYQDNVFALQELDIQWQWPEKFQPHLTQVDLKNVNVRVTASKPPDAPFTFPAIAVVPVWVPNTINIHNVTVDIPCTQGRCLLSATMNTQHGDDAFLLTAHTNPTTDFNENAELKIDFRTPENNPVVNINFSMVNFATVNLKGTLDKQNNKKWAGDASAQIQPPGETWLAQFKKMEIALPEGWQYYFTKPVTLKSQWNANVADSAAPQLSLDWQLEDVAFVTGKPKAGQTLPLLAVTDGHIKANGTAFINFTHPVAVNSNSNVTLNKVSGIYDTTEFTELTGSINVQTTVDKILLHSDNLTAKQVVQGVKFTSAKMQGDYQSSMANRGGGKLAINTLEANMLGGYVNVAQGEYDFAKTKQQMVVELHDIDVATLLTEYPSSDFSGSGRLSGQLPLDISAKGVRILQGSLEAQAPGGNLQYHSARASEMAAKQPMMKLLLEALHDFHYSLLTSDVTMNDDGKLLLAIKIHGNNPEFQNGRPVNFNFNLEENLPALITSLQLTNQISATIQERIQQKMRAKNAATGNP